MKMMYNIESSNFAMKENIKKAVSRMLVLCILSEKDCYCQELTEAFPESLDFKKNPYEIINRMTSDGYIVSDRRKSEDGRLRKYYQITELGKKCLNEQLVVYEECSEGINRIIEVAKKNNLNN